MDVVVQIVQIGLLILVERSPRAQQKASSGDFQGAMISDQDDFKKRFSNNF